MPSAPWIWRHTVAGGASIRSWWSMVPRRSAGSGKASPNAPSSSGSTTTPRTTWPGQFVNQQTSFITRPPMTPSTANIGTMTTAQISPSTMMTKVPSTTRLVAAAEARAQ